MLHSTHLMHRCHTSKARGKELKPKVELKNSSLGSTSGSKEHPEDSSYSETAQIMALTITDRKKSQRQYV